MNPLSTFAKNVEVMLTNVKDRYYRPGPPDKGSTLSFPFIEQSMTRSRGLLVPQTALNNKNTLQSHIISFQFNPTEITYAKGMNYTEHQRLGYSYEIPFWVSGGAKTISFTLTLDGTAGSQYRNMVGKEVVQKNDSNNNEYINFNDYKNSPDGNGKGLLDEIAKYEALMYPMRQTDKELVQFKFGKAEVLDLKQFTNPPYVLFTYGDVAVNCFVQVARKDILFNRKLNPIRTELSITLTVIEAKVLDKSFVATRAVGELLSNFKTG